MAFLLEIFGLYQLDSLQSKEILRILVEKYGVTTDSQCFAENILSEQFIEAPDGVISKLSLESGEIEFVCKSMSELKQAMTNGDDANYFLANSLRKELALKDNIRLLPVTPFITGGPFEAGNLYPVERNKAIDFLVDFHGQTKHLPDGSIFIFEVVP